MQKILGSFKEKVIQEIQLLEEINDEKVESMIFEHIVEEYSNLSLKEKNNLLLYLFNNIRRLGIIQPLIEDTNISEIMINGYQTIYIERNGIIELTDLAFQDKEELFYLIQKIVSKMDRKVNEKNPICDVRLENGARVNIVLSPVAIDGPIVTIRKFPEKKLTRKELIENKTITEEAMNFLELLVVAKYNIFISGGTSSGKTTLLNILSDAIDSNERVITIEDSAELQLHRIENLVRLEARSGEEEYSNQINIRDLIKTSLRMRPDRIIVGEVRGEETIDMLQAMNTGHDGSLSTGHGNSIREMLFRLETMVLSNLEIPLLAIRQQISSAIDIMIHIQKIKGKGRRITDISEIGVIQDGNISLNSLFSYDDKIDCLVRTENELLHQSKLVWN